MPNYRLVRYADDFLVLVFGRRDHAEELRDEVAEALKPMGLRLSVEKTKITHIDEGLDFLGWRIQRHRKLGTDRQYIYTHPARKSVRSVTGKVKELTGRQNVGLSLDSLLHRLNSVLRGWCAYFPSRSFECRFLLPQPLCVDEGDTMDPTQAPRDHLETAPPTLLRRLLVARHRGSGTVQPGQGKHDQIPIPGKTHSGSVAHYGMRN
ncbi:group II intron maturase-specific domain-containing protein [Streptomyces sp. NPDC087659]|uniref:group II intron maturase-specific domain-containing protein n=1 Tax=Streptomyces sp. NPDC087659 TaxID=3365801 RepID=UPI0037FE00A2